MPRHIVLTVCVLAVAATSNTNSFGLVLAKAAEGLGLTAASLGGLRTIESASTIVMAILVAPLVDRVPRKYVLMCGFGLGTAATITLITFSNTLGTVAYFMINGAAVMLVISTITALPGDFVSGRAMSRIMGLVLGSIAFTSILVAPLVGNVAESNGWQMGMLVSTAVTTTALMLTLIIVPSYQVKRPPSSSDGFIQRYRMILGRTPLLMMLGSNILRFAQLGSTLTFVSTIFILRYDMPLGQIGLLFSVVGAVFFLCSTGSGLLLHVLKIRRVLIWGGVTGAVIMIFGFVNHAPLPLGMVAIVAFIGVAAAQINTGTIALLRLAPDFRGAAASWNEFAAGSGSLMGIGLCSIGLAVAGVTGIGVVLASFSTLGTIAALFALKRAGNIDDDETVVIADPRTAAGFHDRN